MLSEDSSRHRNDTLDSDRVVTSHTQHEATDLILNSQQMTQQAITKLVLSVEINGPLSGWTSTGSAQTVSTPQDLESDCGVIPSPGDWLFVL